MSSFLSVVAFFAAFVLTVAGITFKLHGSLQLSWWIVACPMPIVIILSIALFIFGETKLGKRLGLEWD